jgi:hypothetical protein
MRCGETCPQCRGCPRNHDILRKNVCAAAGGMQLNIARRQESKGVELAITGLTPVSVDSTQQAPRSPGILTAINGACRMDSIATGRCSALPSAMPPGRRSMSRHRPARWCSTRRAASALGLAFSIAGIVIGWRRLRQSNPVLPGAQ